MCEIPWGFQGFTNHCVSCDVITDELISHSTNCEKMMKDPLKYMWDSTLESRYILLQTSINQPFQIMC